MLTVLEHVKIPRYLTLSWEHTPAVAFLLFEKEGKGEILDEHTLTVLACRVVPIINGLLQELLRLVLPKLRDRRKSLNHCVPELAVLPFNLADIDGFDRISIGIELDRSSRRIGNLYSPKRGKELLLVLNVPTDDLGCLVDPPRRRVARLGVVSGNFSVLRPEFFDKPPINWRVDRSAVNHRCDGADRLVAEGTENKLIKARPASDQRQSRLQPRVLVLLGKPQR